MLRYCEMCAKNELETTDDVVPVCIDDNFETEMCRPCIRVARREMTIEIYEED
jgi:hypothetical protein